MKIFIVAFASLVLVLQSIAQDHKTIYVDRMEGLEAQVEKALQNAELPFDFIEEQKQPELKANLAKMHSAYAEILYKSKHGRTETHRLELWDVERKKVIASHEFALNSADEGARQQAAEDFANKVKKALAKSKPAGS